MVLARAENRMYGRTYIRDAAQGGRQVSVLTKGQATQVTIVEHTVPVSYINRNYINN